MKADIMVNQILSRRPISPTGYSTITLEYKKAIVLSEIDQIRFPEIFW